MNEEERIKYRSLLARVLDWRNFDGDGITDLLRCSIMAALAFYEDDPVNCCANPDLSYGLSMDQWICSNCGTRSRDIEEK